MAKRPAPFPAAQSALLIFTALLLLALAAFLYLEANKSPPAASAAPTPEGRTLYFATATPVPGVITGSVTTSSGTAINAAGIELRNATGSSSYTATNAAGLYYAGGLRPGAYNVTASKTGYISSTKPATLTAGGTVSLNFTLSTPTPTPTPGWLYGYVRDNVGNLVSSATVEIKNSSGTLQTLTTNSSGRYESSHTLKPGSYDLGASKSGYQSWTTALVPVSAGKGTNINFSLQSYAPLTPTPTPVPSPGWFHGYVKNSSGSAVAYAQITADDAYGYSHMTETDGSGHYGYTHSLPPGAYNITASKSGYSDSKKTGITLSAGAGTQVNFTLYRPPGWIYGYVKNSTGSAVSGATVNAYSAGHGFAVGTNPSGFYNLTFPDLYPGTYNVTVSKSGYSSGTKIGVAVPTGAGININFTLSVPGWLYGYVRTSNGTGVAGATVNISNSSGVQQALTTNSSGRYESAHSLEPGKYDISVRKSGYGPSSITNYNIGVSAGSGTSQNFVMNPVPSPTPSPSPGWVYGRVINSTGSAIADATIAIRNSTVTMTSSTNATGHYPPGGRLPFSPGSYNVTVSKPGYSSATKTGITVAAGAGTNASFTLSPSPTPSPSPGASPSPTPGWFYGYVKNSTGSAINGALVAASSAALGTSFGTLTNAGGYYTTAGAGLQPGPYNVTASMAGYASSTRLASIAVGNGTNVNFSLSLSPSPTPSPSPPPGCPSRYCAGGAIHSGCALTGGVCICSVDASCLSRMCNDAGTDCAPTPTPTPTPSPTASPAATPSPGAGYCPHEKCIGGILYLNCNTDPATGHCVCQPPAIMCESGACSADERDCYYAETPTTTPLPECPNYCAYQILYGGGYYEPSRRDCVYQSRYTCPHGCDLYGVACAEATPTPAPSPGATSTPAPTETPTPAPHCGDGILDPGEMCERNVTCPPGFFCNSQCICQEMGLPTPTPEGTPPPIACTADAMICPDGSAVGRVPPDCNFAPCPSPTPTPAPTPAPQPCPLLGLILLGSAASLAFAWKN